jgi:hypothetical protein
MRAFIATVLAPLAQLAHLLATRYACELIADRDK